MRQIGMEGCGTAHYWAQELAALGHTVRLMPALYVKAYAKRGKSDAIDAEAICEAVTRPTMRFVPSRAPIDKTAQSRQSDAGLPFVFGGFRIIEEARFNALSESALRLGVAPLGSIKIRGVPMAEQGGKLAG